MGIESEKGHLVLQAFDKYYESLTAVKRRRQMWEEVIESVLINTLVSIKKGMPQLGVQVQNTKVANNCGSIVFSMNDTPSGLFKPLSATSVENYLKTGGALAFSQSYNGKINIVVHFPNVAGFTSEKPSIIIKTISPELLTENFIMETVAEFLHYMAQWEEE